MQTARRLYVYLLAGISLGVLVAGLSMLLSVLLERLGLGGGPQLGGGDVLGEQLTLAAALTVVSLPVWLIHWMAAERSVAPQRPDAAIERSSGERGLYFAIAMGALLLAAASGLSSAIQSAVLSLADEEQFASQTIGGGLAVALVAGAAWVYHLRIRTRDWSRGPIVEAGAWLPRTYLYVAAFAGLMFLLGGIGELLEVGGRLALDIGPEFSDPTARAWWAFPLAAALSSVLLGGGVWLGHATYANHLVRDAGWRGESERRSKLRLAYYVAVLVATAAGTVLLVGEGAGNALAAVFGVPDVSGSARVTGLIALPLLSAVPYAIAWWLHGRGMDAEASASGSAERAETEDRLELYPVALVGLAFAATATAWLIGLLIESVLGGERVLSGGFFDRRELARWVPLALLGAGLWIWRWGGVTRRAQVDPAGEAASTTRRAALLLVLAASVLSGIAAAGLILYRAFGALFGVRQAGDPVLELSVPIGVLLVALVVAAYHGLQLRRDQSLRATTEARAVEVPTSPVALTLRLSGPGEGDASAVISSLREQLPAGYELEVVDAHT